MSINLTIDQKLKALDVASNLACFYAGTMKYIPQEEKLESNSKAEPSIQCDGSLIEHDYDFKTLNKIVDVFFNNIVNRVSE